MICTTATIIQNSSNTLNSQFLSWLAGFWEGEGSLSIVDSKGHTRVCLQIAQSKERGKKILEEIKEVFQTGNIYCKYPSTGKYQSINPVWTWQVACVRDVIFIIEKILPYMNFRDSEVEEKLKRIKAIDQNRSVRPWSAQEIAYLKQYHGKKTNADIGKYLERQEHSVIQKAQSLEITKPQHFWNPLDLQFLRDNFGKITAKEIGEKLGRSYSNVHQKIIKLREKGELGKVDSISKIKWSIDAKRKIKESKTLRSKTK